MFKNTAGQKIALFAFDSNGAKTGDAAHITAYVNKDWAGVNALVDAGATEIESTNAPGWYLFDLTQAETNADALLFTGKSSTSGVEVVGQLIFTTPAGFSSSVAQTGDSYERLGAPFGASHAADMVEVLASLQNALITLNVGGLTGTVKLYTPGTAQSAGNLLRTIPISRASTDDPFTLARVS